jgi:F-type H+-transporting ATPase subunit delta
LKPVKQAKKYAKTLINVVGIDETEKALTELMLIENLMLKSKGFKGFLVNPGFSQTDKENALKQVAAKVKLSEKMVKFVLHLIEMRAIIALSQIIKIATAIYLEKKRRARATVLTPVELSKSHEERIKASLKKLINKDVDIEVVMDPTLLGGVLVKVGSTMYDSSIKGQLRLLKDELIKG